MKTGRFPETADIGEHIELLLNYFENYPSTSNGQNYPLAKKFMQAKPQKIMDSTEGKTEGIIVAWRQVPPFELIWSTLIKMSLAKYFMKI